VLLETKPGALDQARPLRGWTLPECFALLRRRLEGEDGGEGTREYIRVLRMLERHPLPVLRAAVGAAVGAGGAQPPRFLFEGARSGSGVAADWDSAARLARAGELILAGGLNAHNVAAAIRAVRPYGVDVSSGVESAPGRKSAHKIAEFVEAARAAAKGMANDAN